MKSINTVSPAAPAKQESKWGEIRSDFFDDDEGIQYIDAWFTDDDNEEGEVIAKVHMDTGTVDYLDEDAKTDSYAQEIIREVLEGRDVLTE